ncbi:ABC transporter permease [Ancylobacter sp. 6x-1]|uniref:ABC transporter permease n=1 Tax=Ancylobacter crimeensis TaxID=2579147 RepID=A0ABT0DAF6_9HYPH|nr:ABC transporter permease [Ancylobacter crimeensis]MCK0196948.1 ABC transporter permease [Ancylobacter crimeensis]
MSHVEGLPLTRGVPQRADTRLRIRRQGRWLLGLLVPAGAALAWELAVRAGLANGRLMPPPSVLGATLLDLAQGGDLALHIRATLARMAAGFALGVLAGTALGVLTGTFAGVRAALDPTLQALRAIPSIAWVPLFILWFGIFEASKIMLIAVGVAFPVYLGTLGAIRTVDRRIVEVGRSFRLGRLALARRILFPAVLPHYVVALRSGLGLGWMFVVAAEFMGASEGLGYLLVDGQQLGKPAQILAAILVFALLGKLTDTLLVAAAAPFLRWQDVAQDVVPGEPPRRREPC